VNGWMSTSPTFYLLLPPPLTEGRAYIHGVQTLDKEYLRKPFLVSSQLNLDSAFENVDGFSSSEELPLNNKRLRLPACLKASS